MSGRKNSLPSFQIVLNASMTTTVTSSVVNIEYLDNIGLQANLTGASSANGTLVPQVSIDYSQDNNGNVLNAGNWVDLPTTAQQPIVAGSPAQTYFNLTELSSPWLRLQYRPTSGTGTLNAFVTAKML